MKEGDLGILFGRANFVKEVLASVGEYKRLYILLPESLPFKNRLVISGEDLAGIFKRLCLKIGDPPIDDLSKVKILIDPLYLQFLLQRGSKFGVVLNTLLRNTGINQHSYYSIGMGLCLSDRLRELIYLMVVLSPGVRDLELERRRLRNSIAQRDNGRVSIIMVNYNNYECMERCIDSAVRLSDYPDIEVIIVDNSPKPAKGILKRIEKYYREVRIIVNEENLGISVARNQGAVEADGDYLIFMDDDIELCTPGWALHLIEALNYHPRIGACGPIGVAFISDNDPSYQLFIHVPGMVIPVTYCASGLLAMKREAFLASGGWSLRLNKTGREDYHMGYILREQNWVSVTPANFIGIKHYRARRGKEDWQNGDKGREILREDFGDLRRIINLFRGNRTIHGLWDREGRCYKG